jgi:hypothetical protein
VHPTNVHGLEPLETSQPARPLSDQESRAEAKRVDAARWEKLRPAPVRSAEQQARREAAKLTYYPSPRFLEADRRALAMLKDQHRVEQRAWLAFLRIFRTALLRLRPRSRAARRRSPSSRPRAPSDDCGSEPPGPGRVGDEPFSSREVSRVARIVEGVCGRELTPARFHAIVHPLTVGLSAEQRGHARLLIFLELSDALQRSFYNGIRADADRESDRQLPFGPEGGAV